MFATNKARRCNACYSWTKQRTNVFQVEQLADGGGALGAEAAGLGVVGDTGELSSALLHNNCGAKVRKKEEHVVRSTEEK